MAKSQYQLYSAYPYLEYIKMLIDAGANVHNYCDSAPPFNHWGIRNKTVLEWACCDKHDNAQLVKFLFERDPQGHAHELQKYSCLWNAIECSNKNIVLYLLLNGQNVNAVNPFGETCIKLAIDKKNCRIMKKLLEYGADVHIKDIHGKSALDHARILNDPFVNEVLRYELGLVPSVGPMLHPDAEPVNATNEFSTDCSICRDPWVAPHVIVTRTAARIYCATCIQDWIKKCNESRTIRRDPLSGDEIILGPFPFFN